LKDAIADAEWQPQNRINYLNMWSSLYKFAEKNKWVDENIAKLISRPKIEGVEPEIFTVDEVKRLLENANAYGLLPHIAVGLFAGIRSTELSRLTRDAINFETKEIVIPATIAKLRSRRVIDHKDAMNPLFAWLETCREELKGREPIYQPAKFRWNKKEFLEAAGIPEWKDNVLRHSFGSYHFAAFENEGLTARLMGNSPNMIHKHYKAIVSKSEAEKFWALRPEPSVN
jgi:integrase